MTIHQAEAEVRALAERVEATMGDDPELKGVAAMLYATLGAIRAKALHRFVVAVTEVVGREMEGRG